MKGYAIIILCVALFLIMAGCSSQTPEEIALEVANEWTVSSIDRIADRLGKAAAGGAPLLDNIASSKIREQIEGKVQWRISNPSKISEEKYRVVAGASVPLDIRVAVVNWSGQIGADFLLQIDTKDKSVVRWAIMPESIAIRGSGGSGAGGGGGVEIDSDKIKRDVQKGAEDIKPGFPRSNQLSWI